MKIADEKGPAVQVWHRPAPIGIFQAYSAFGGIVSPVLAGFALATITLLLTIGTADRPVLSEWAVVTLAATAALSIYAIQFNGTALGYAVTPGDRLAWTPEATVDAGALERVREQNAKDLQIGKTYGDRAGWCYDLSVLAFLVSLALLLAPGSWTLLRAVPFLIAVLAGAAQVWWMVAARALKPGNPWREALLPSRRGVALKQPVPDLNTLSQAAVAKEMPMWAPTVTNHVHGGAEDHD